MSVFLCLLVVSTSLLIIDPAPARADLPVIDLMGNALKTTDTVWVKIKAILKILWDKAASIALQSAVRNTLNTIAYDTATWAGSGDAGQKPQWLTGDVGSTLANVGDQAAGQFISGIDKQFGVNLCAPSLDVKLKIGLGLATQTKPPAPDCTASEMVKNWDTAISSVNSKDFLKKFSGYFDVQQNDLGIGLSLQTNLLEEESTAKINEQTRFAGQGNWLDVRNIAGKIKTTPDQAKEELKASQNAQLNAVGKFTGDALTDALNVFLNQLAITAFQNGMRTLTESLNKSDSSESSLASPTSAPQSGGIAAAQGVLRKIIEPQFNSRGDYDILNQLTLCNTGVFGVGPTDCVLDQNFRQAVANQKTVAEALAEGSLKGEAPFGFVMGGDNKPIEPAWNQGYPYRSLIILRKYRIIPVGWEIAAQYIQSHPNSQDVSGHNNLNDLLACFENGQKNESARNGYYADWCQGLIDPTWVLKAPQNYCVKQGFGSQVLNSTVVDQGVDGQQNKLPPKLMLTRTDSYCGDEQSCIKENNDGSCKYFGYCTEDKRLWKFGNDSCDAQYNTCQAFKTEAGETASYLKNSLQYCDQSEAGCEKYAIASAIGYNKDPLNIWGSNSGFLYLNKGAGVCEQSSEGCHGFYRIASGLGSNLIRNSGFEQNEASDKLNDVGGGIKYLVPASWNPGNSYELEKVWKIQSSNASITDAVPAGNGNTLHINSSFSPAGLLIPDRSSSDRISVLPEGFVMEPEVSYTFSADIYNVSADRVDLTMGRGTNSWVKASAVSKNTWERVSVTINNNPDILANEAIIFGWSASGNVEFYIDNVKFEVGNKTTNYSGYTLNNLIYEKFMPAYLRDACYVNPGANNFNLKNNAPAACSQFARACSREEANCELYTNTENRSQIPAAVTDKNYCDKSCVGYNAFIQSEDNFSSNHLNYFIPATAKSCAAASVGCEEFTNLASTTSGGEQKEYYSYLRQCVKPGEATCGEFYSWEGSQTQGQQLVKYSLEQGAAGPYSDYDSLCTEAIYKLPPTDPAYNPDCRQFYDKQGGTSYHLYSRTVTCTEDCHDYRLTRKNIDSSLPNSSICSYADSRVFSYTRKHMYHWDSVENGCVYCKNGGVWDDAQENCVYKAYINESITCEAADSGCSTYNGNSGANSKVVLDSEFENTADPADGWSTGSNSTASYVAGAHSFKFSSTNSIDKVVGKSVVTGASYNLSFLAKTENGDAQISAEFGNGSPYELNQFSTVTVKDTGWKMYSLNLPKLNHVVSDNEKLIIWKTSGSPTAIYIDNIKLTQITDRYFLIEDSWNTPAVCDKDLNGNPSPLYMLGCAEYTDRLSNIHYLHDFDRVCQLSAVGCEAMVDTQNSINSKEQNFTKAGGATTIVPADRVVYAVYDLDKLCSATDKGCERLGKAVDYAGESIYQDTYLKNDPDRYGSTLCTAAGVGCNLFTSADGGSSYFKDPKNMVCEWRQGAGGGKNNGWDWFKKKIKRCGGIDTGNVCASNKDCGSGSCQLETADTPCPTEKLKTLGMGGAGNEVLQPGFDGVYHWAGTCPIEQSGCTEYIDPVSDFSSNIIYNSDFSQHIGSATYADGWSDAASRQNIVLEGNTLYVLTVQSDGNNMATITTTGNAPLHELRTTTNTFYPLATQGISVNANQSKTFYVDRSISKDGVISVTNNKVSPPQNSKIILRKAVVDYQLAASVDKTTCNGVAKPADGCVYFNERAVNSSGIMASLDPGIEAWASFGIDLTNDKNANLLLKVHPDRVCNKWLACKSYIKDENNKNVCFDVANCDHLDDSGNCLNFPVLTDVQKENNRFYAVPPEENSEKPETIKNLTGYVKVGLVSTSSVDLKIIPNDLLNFGVMKQDGKNVVVSNGDFEAFVPTTTDKGLTWIANPAGWTTAGGTPWSTSTVGSLYSVIMDPKTAQNLNVGYPMIGKSFLKYSANPSVTTVVHGTVTSNIKNFPKSSAVFVQADKPFYLSYYINTSGLGGSANAQADIKILNADNSVLEFKTSAANGWILQTQQFTPATNRINIILSATDGSVGDIYIDDIQITPVLLIKTDPNNNFYDRQTCRLYPKEDSLSCDYTNDTGITQKGDRGYCLQYDRTPGDPNTCLLWWPIDKVKGSGTQESQAQVYSGREPLYYCIGANVGATTVSGTTAVYPYIDASEVSYAVDEVLKVTVNGKEVTKSGGLTGGIGGRIDQRGTLAGKLLPTGTLVGTPAYGKINGNIIPLQYGTNTIKVTYSATTEGGNTFLRINGKYHYFKTDLSTTIDNFDFVQMFKSTAHANGINYTLSDGRHFQVDFHCGDAHHDGHVGVATCDERKYGGTNDDTWGNTEFITNVDPDYCLNGSAGIIALCASNPNTCLPVPACIQGPLCVPTCGSCERYTLCGDNQTIDMTLTFNIPTPACGKIAQVVDSYGQNKVWAERVRQGSDFPGLTCNAGMPLSYTIIGGSTATIDPAPGDTCTSTTKFAPFGAANPPAGTPSLQSDPSLWLNPLPYQSLDDTVNGQMGQLQSTAYLPYLFAESYGVWKWDLSKKYYVTTDEDWHGPKNLCSNNTRPSGYTVASNCAVAPVVSNINLNSALNAHIFGRGFVNLTFNSQIDSQQAPLASYEIDWGDTDTLAVAGVGMATRPNPNDPHSVYHSYDYYDLLSKYQKNHLLTNNPTPTLTCDANVCKVKPRVKLMDNWGWCSEGINNFPCPSGVCVKADKTPSTLTCKTNKRCVDTGTDFKICADTWWEPAGEVIVYEPGTQ